MKHKIQSGQSLKAIEKNIELELPLCDFWGDLDLSIEEYEVIRERLRAFFENASMNIESICKSYPIAVTTFMVFFVRFKYNINFWGVLSEELGIFIPDYMHTIFGKCTKRMFIKFNMDYSDVKDDVHTNLAPIMYEACLPPESSLNDLFYVLSYDTYKVFDPQTIIDELIEMRSYSIRKPLLRFLSRFKEDRAVEFLLEVRDAMLTDENDASVSNRYVYNYLEWKKSEKNNETTSFRKNQEFQTKPYLFFDNGNKGLCICLPRTILANEWVEEVAWIIENKSGYNRTVYCSVMGDEGRRFTESIFIPVPPSRSYSVRIEDAEGLDDKETRIWEVKGIEDRILYFNANGRQINQNFLVWPYGCMIIPDCIDIESTKDLDISDQYYPTNCTGYRIVAVTPLSSEACMKYYNDGFDYTIYTRPQINMSLKGKTIFSLPETNNIFTQFPILEITVDGHLPSDEIEIRIGNDSYTTVLDYNSENIFDLSLIVSSSINKYGTYSVRLYQLGKFIKQVEFNYVPNIATDYVGIKKWPDINSRKEKFCYKFKKLDDWEYTFDRCTIDTDDKNYVITVPPSVGSIKMTLKSIGNSSVFCEFELPVRPIEMAIVDVDGNIVENVTNKLWKVGLDQITNIDNWLSVKTFGEYRNSIYSIRLKTLNGIEQNEKVLLSQNGAGNVNLSSFSDTLRNCPLPAEIQIICDGDEHKTLTFLVITDQLSMERPVRFLNTPDKSYVILNIKDDGKDINVNRFGFSNSKFVIPYSRSRLDNKTGETRGYPCPQKLVEGIYQIIGSKNKDIFDFEEDDDIDLNVGNEVLFICKTNFKGTPSTSKEWLDFLVHDTLTANKRDLKDSISCKILSFPKLKESLTIVRFDDYDIEKLVALAYFANSKISKLNKELIKECMRFISVNYLQRGDRYKIIVLLVLMKVPQEVFDICLNEYSLLLFYSTDNNVKSLASEVEPYSLELSLMLMLSTNCKSRDCIGRERFRDLIGKDAIRKLLSVPSESDSIKIVEEQKKFIRDFPGCKVKIHLDDEISGNFTSIQGMICYDKKYPYFDVSKKVDYGIYFGRIKFVDQYVNWYKNTHDRNSIMYLEIENKMQMVVKENYKDIMNKISALKNDRRYGKMTLDYEKVIKARCGSDISMIPLTIVSYPRYFYLLGLAAYLAKLPSFTENLDEYRNVGIRFLSEAFIVSPKLAKRDVLMSGIYMYLKRKEERICL